MDVQPHRDFRAVFNRVVPVVEKTYGVEVTISDVVDPDMDGWASDWWRADYQYLLHFYATGEKLDVRSLLAPGSGEPLAPLPIPRFTPQRFASRWSF